jgi:hypothetical protein
MQIQKSLYPIFQFIEPVVNVAMGQTQKLRVEVLVHIMAELNIGNIVMVQGNIREGVTNKYEQP